MVSIFGRAKRGFGMLKKSKTSAATQFKEKRAALKRVTRKIQMENLTKESKKINKELKDLRPYDKDASKKRADLGTRTKNLTKKVSKHLDDFEDLYTKK